jgi:hypothetical protein
MVSVTAGCQLPEQLYVQAEHIVSVMNHEISKLDGLARPVDISVTDAVFSRVIDPENQLPGYEGIWRNSRNERCGSLIFNTDGSFYAEYDLFLPHPKDQRWFIEMVTAWGRDTLTHAELQLIPSP